MYAVLATVSSGYPPLQGRSSTCYSPVRHFQAYCYTLTFDLHVLSTPPAFILSQDQTLHKNLTENHSGYSRTPNSPPNYFNRNFTSRLALLGLEFDCLSTLQLLMYHFYLTSISPSAPPLTTPRLTIDSQSTALRFRLSCRLLSQGQVCNLHYHFSLVKSVSQRLLLSSASRQSTRPDYASYLLPTIYSLLPTAYYLLITIYCLLLRTSPARSVTSLKGHRHFASPSPLVRHKKKCYTTSPNTSNPTLTK